jgi:hypothetical protein
LNHLGGVDDGLHARSTESIHSERRSFDGQSRTQADVARSIECVSGSLLRVAEDGVVEIFGINSSAFYGSAGGDRSQFLRREILQLAAIPAKGRACPTDDGDVSWLEHD